MADVTCPRVVDQDTSRNARPGQREPFRVADIAVIGAELPREKIRTTPPLVVIEILSPEVRIARYLTRLNDYHSLGVKHIWMIDPGYDGNAATLYDCSSGDWILRDRLEVSGTPIYLKLQDLSTARS